jgi:membrane dipeptidase
MRWLNLIFLFIGGFLLSPSGSIDPAKLHNDAIVADLHCDTVLRMNKGFNFAIRDTSGQVDIPRLEDGGIDLQVFACWLPTSTPKDSCRIRADQMLDSLDYQIKRNSIKIAICRSASEADSIIASGRIAAFLAIENGVAIEDDLENLNHYYQRGVRYLTLTHTASSDWCISSADTTPKFDGLTEFGRSVVRRMNQLGMIVDVSHASPRAVEEVLKITTAPIIASHSCVYSICHHDRNLTDNQIRDIAKNGGVIGVNFFGGYLSDRWNEVTDSITFAHETEIDSISALYKDDYGKRHEALGWLFALMATETKKIGINVSMVVDHIDHIVKLVGPDYVGLGSDFDGVFSLPEGLTDCSMMHNITVELVKRGYSEPDIKKILGGNFMRVFAKVCG